MLIKNKQILLVYHSYQHKWFLPGGGVRKGERLEQTAKREIAEELGGQIGQMQLFGAYTNFNEYKNDHIIVFYSTNFTVDWHFKNWEIAKKKLFPLDRLPDNIDAGQKRRIDEWCQGCRSNFGPW